jgi:hypothetical protein
LAEHAQPFFVSTPEQSLGGIFGRGKAAGAKRLSDFFEEFLNFGASRAGSVMDKARIRNRAGKCATMLNGRGRRSVV